MTIKEFANIFKTHTFVDKVLRTILINYGSIDNCDKPIHVLPIMSKALMYIILGKIPTFFSKKYTDTLLLHGPGYPAIIDMLVKNKQIVYDDILQINRENNIIICQNSVHYFDKLIVSCLPHKLCGILKYDNVDRILLSDYWYNKFVTIIAKVKYTKEKNISKILGFNILNHEIMHSSTMKINAILFLDENTILMPCNLKIDNVDEKKIIFFLKSNGFTDVSYIKIFNWNMAFSYKNKEILKTINDNIQSHKNTYYIGRIMAGTDGINFILNHCDKLLVDYFNIPSQRSSLYNQFTTYKKLLQLAK